MTLFLLVSDYIFVSHRSFQFQEEDRQKLFEAKLQQIEVCFPAILPLLVHLFNDFRTSLGVRTTPPVTAGGYFFSRTRRRTAHHYIEREKGPKWTKVQCHNRQKKNKNKMKSSTTSCTRNSPDPSKCSQKAKTLELLRTSHTPALHLIQEKPLNGAQGRVDTIKYRLIAMQP
jgi:hypothetical protein